MNALGAKIYSHWLGKQVGEAVSYVNLDHPDTQSVTHLNTKRVDILAQ